MNMWGSKQEAWKILGETVGGGRQSLSWESPYADLAETAQQ